MTGQSGEDNVGATLILEHSGGALEGKWTLHGEVSSRM